MFKSYLSNRLQCCTIDGENSDHKINPAGIPQGSPLGPLLFLIYVNDLPSALETSDSNLYADDSNLTNADRLLKVAQDKLDADLERLEKWLYLNKLTPNIAKTEYMIIATSPKLKSLDYSPLIKLNGKPIKRVLKSDYLGFIVDENLSWVYLT